MGLLLLLAGGAYFFLNSSVRIRDWRSDRAVEVAQKAFSQNQPEKAALAAQRALQLNNHNRRAQEILAKLAGKFSAADEMEHRRQILKQNPADQEAILAFCLAAIRAGEIEAATEVLGSWPADTHDIRFCRTAAALALARKQYRSALSFEKEAAQFPDAEPPDRLRLAALEALSNDPAERAHGVAVLEHLKSDEEIGVGARQALIFSAMERSDLLTAKSYLEDWLPGGITKSNLFLALEVYSRLDLSKLNELVKQGLSAFKQDGETCGQIIDWLNRHGDSDLVVDSSKAVDPEARKNSFFKFAYADALDRIGRWQELLDLTDGDTWKHVDCLRLALRTRAMQKLSQAQAVGSSRVWKQCLDLAGQNQRALWALNDFAQRWSWDPQVEETLWAIAACPQGQAKAIEDLENLYRKRRDTRGLFRIAKRILELKPDDRPAQSQFALLGLLLYDSIDTKRDSFSEFAKKNWEENTNRTPEMASAYAYCLLLKGNNEEAATVFQTFGENDRRSQALYAGLVNAANGNHDAALSYFQIAAVRSDLLPEEQAILQRALALAR